MSLLFPKFVRVRGDSGRSLNIDLDFSMVARSGQDEGRHGIPRGGYFPVQDYVDFLEFLTLHRDTIQILTYRHFPWETLRLRR